MVKKSKVGRPANPGKVIGFYAPKELLEEIDQSLQYTGGTVSVFLRDAVKDATRRAMMDYKNKTLKTYTGGGSIEPQKNG